MEGCRAEPDLGTGWAVAPREWALAGHQQTCPSQGRAQPLMETRSSIRGQRGGFRMKAKPETFRRGAPHNVPTWMIPSPRDASESPSLALRGLSSGHS